MTEFFAEQDEALQESSLGSGQHLGTEGESAGTPSGQTLGGGAASSSSGRPQQSSAGRSKIATLADYSSGHADSDDDDDQVNQDFFAGGEKSGLAVQNPEDIKKKIIEKASK